jgi:Domain of unknown function (DUF1854)
MADGSTPFRLHHDDWGRLVLTLGGQEHVGVEAARAFPLTAPRLAAVCSDEGRELLWIDDLDALPPDVRGVLEEELARRDFVPVLKRILRVSAAVEPSEWEVETDRGPTRFLLNSEDDIHALGEGKALVTDSNGVRYLIPDLGALDAHSRRLLERYL